MPLVSNTTSARQISRAGRCLIRLVSMAMTIGVLAACSPVRLVESINLLTDVVAPARTPGTSDKVTRTTIHYVRGDQNRFADLYVPIRRPEAALVLVPGAARQGWRDPRLVSFADTLANAGFAVMVPRLPGANPLWVSIADADAIADAAAQFSEFAQVPKLGMAAISYAVGPTILAALRPDTADVIHFILAVGGYHDIVAAITYLTTGAYRPTSQFPWRFQPVYRDAKWLFLEANAERVEDPDGAGLKAIARSKLNAPQVSVSALAARLGPNGWAVYRLLTNGDPDRVPELIAALPRQFREQILALDLSRRDLGRLKAELILVHGRNDPMVPYTESANLARSAPPGQAFLFLVDSLQHVDPGVPALNDVVTLVTVSYRLLTERSALPQPTIPVWLTPVSRRSGLR